jgi:nitrite reductase/ring-hydroxylating ferredoxin subunit
MRFVALEKLLNLHDSYTRRFKIDHHEVLLIQRAGERYLVEARCPHREHPLDLGSITDGSIQCAGHHYLFSLRDGALLQATEEPCRGLRVYPLVHEGNEVGFMYEDAP